MAINLRIAVESDKELWDELVEKSTHGTIFHTWDFLKIINEHTKSTLYPIIGLRGSTPIGICPFFLQNKHSTKLVFSPPPGALLLYIGPSLIGYDKLKQSKKESIFQGFQKALNDFLKSEIHFNYIRIRTAPGFIDSRSFLWTGYKVELLYTYIIELTNGYENVWKNFNKQVRIDVNKTEREGVKVREGTKKDLEFLRASIADRFVEQGLNPKDYSGYLKKIYDSFYPDNFRVFVGEYENNIVGGLTLFCYKNRASLWMGIPKTELKGIYPNDLVLCESIKWACEAGFNEYEIMDAGDDPRLRHFKSKFNPYPLMWYSAEKYSSWIYNAAEKALRAYQKIKR